jgi:hypothetical protein
MSAIDTLKLKMSEKYSCSVHCKNSLFDSDEDSGGANVERVAKFRPPPHVLGSSARCPDRISTWLFYSVQ